MAIGKGGGAASTRWGGGGKGEGDMLRGNRNISFYVVISAKVISVVIYCRDAKVIRVAVFIYFSFTF